MRFECKRPAIGAIVLDRPPANAIGYGEIDALERAIAEAAAADCCVLVVIGMGRFFCAGADIAIMKPEGRGDSERAQRLAAFARSLQILYDRFETFPAPTIAAMQGTATGGGLELALACDFRIAAREASYGLPETKLGLIPGAGGTQRLPDVVGRARALDLILRGRLIDGEAAAAMGLANDCVPADRVKARAMEVAEELAAQPREAIREARRCIRLARSEAGFDAEVESTRALHDNPDTVARIEAFLSRRDRRK